VGATRARAPAGADGGASGRRSLRRARADEGTDQAAISGQPAPSPTVEEPAQQRSTPRHDMLDPWLPSGVAERSVAAGLQSGSAAQRAHRPDGGGIPPLRDPGEGETMAQLEFDEATNRLMEEFNASAGATRRRSRLLEVLALQPGEQVLDVGSGPGHYAFAMASAVGDTGGVAGFDIARDSL